MGKEQKENVNKELYREIFLPWILEGYYGKTREVA